MAKKLISSGERRHKRVGSTKRKKLRNKADRLVTKIYTGQPCEICLTMGIQNAYRTCPHHAVNKSLSAYLRHEPKIIVVLCPEHHIFSVEIAAHSKYQPAVKKYLEWLGEYRPVAYEFLMTYKRWGGKKPDYEKRIEVLDEMLKEM